MIIRFAGRCAAAALAVVLVALPASAQTPKTVADLTEAQQDEAYCVYNDIAENDDSFDLVAEHFVYSDQSAEDAKKADAALTASQNKCAAKYGWNDKKKSIAGYVGLFGTAVDYLADDLSLDGVDDKTMDKVYAILDTLSDADLEAFLNSSWSKNAALVSRINGQLKVAGVPDDDYTLETGRYMIEAAVLGANALFEWVDAVAK